MRTGYRVTMLIEASKHEYYSAGLCLQGSNRLWVFTMKSYQQLTFSLCNCNCNRHVINLQWLLPLQKLKDPPDISGLQLMSTERCVKLIAVSMANNLDEVWISSEPTLLMVYLNQYFPNLYRWYVLCNVTSLFMQICSGLNANEIQIPYDMCHKVSSLVKSI